MNEHKEKQDSNEDCLSRRKLLKTAGYAGAAALLVGGLSSKAGASVNSTYPQFKVGNIKDVKEGQPVKFDYPLVGRKSVLIDCGSVVEGGIGPKKSIVAYSMLCTDVGCGVELDSSLQMLVCECHESV